MKKRLFITSALMTAVMAASLATGTYAWYQASGTGGITTTEAHGTVATVDPTINLEGNIAVTATVAEVSPGSQLCLAEWVPGVGEAKGTFKTYYLNSNKEEVQYDYTKKSQVVSKAYAVSVTIPKGEHDKSPDAIEYAKNVSALLGQTITITVTADDAGAEGAKRTKVWASPKGTALVDNCDFSDTFSVPYTFPSASASVSETTVVAYVAVYVDGNHESGSEGNKVNVVDQVGVGISGNFTVTISNS